MALSEYRKKRDFTKTSEPAGAKPQRRSSSTSSVTGSGKTAAKTAHKAAVKGTPNDPGSKGLKYVIQKHQASHLHYDLRLEEDGVLRSWAVPKVPVNSTGVRRLAMQVEDHPLGYGDFEGTIPEGEYGAGSVEIWDRGTYRPVESGPEKMVVDISGRRLSGHFALVRIKPKEGTGKPWLFFKLKDQPGGAGKGRP